MGGSAVGSMYYLFGKLPKEKQLFKLPYLATLFALVYAALEKELAGLMVLMIGVLWLVFLLLHWVKDNKHFRESIIRIIECCKNW